ncbi:MAG TPA: membrane protein insertase YidC [Frankiaceae bacterium]|nr:membrane protein insertase YidC [Frankiaceae bacterium]
MLDPLYNLVARGVIVFHNLLSPIFGKHSFFSYAIAIAIIVVIVRILIFPLFVRSVRAQRTMQMLQPRIKEIREKYKNDKQRMNQEVMKLQKEHGNPLLGCLPLLLQIPLFISLYHVFNAVSRAPTLIQGHILQFKATSGLTGGYYDQTTHFLGTLSADHQHVIPNSKAAEVAGLATAKFAGITLSSALTSSKKTLELFGANGTTVKIVAAVMIVIMAITVYITQHQIMSRGGPVDPQQQKIQRVMLYGSPILLAVFGLRFPIAVLVYWLTTNTWSMAQQVFILRKMPPVLPGTTASTATSGRASAAAGKGGKASLRKGAAPEPPAAPQKLAQVRQTPAINPPPNGAKPADGEADEAGQNGTESAQSDQAAQPDRNGAGGTNKGANAAGTGRTVSSGGGQRPRRNNRPAAKPKGKGPRKGGRR